MSMKISAIRTIILLLCLVFGAPALAAAIAGSGNASQPAASVDEKIPWPELGARAGKKYSGEALSVSAMESGAQLRTDFQRLRGEVTQQGLVIESTVPGKTKERFALRADDLGRIGKKAITLPRAGSVETSKNLARWVRPGVTEEYSVSVDGMRQDFVISERPEGDGPLQLELALSGARAETAGYGARLTLDGSGRKLAYSRLKAWDAKGHALSARMMASSADRLTVVVEDTGAVWPVRIDPTFSDDNWVSMGCMNAVGTVNALAIDTSGNLYVGSSSASSTEGALNNIVKWDGTHWSTLGSAMNGAVNALAIDGLGNIYAGGVFTTAGGINASRIAKWNGSNWSALGSGMDSTVNALAIDGSGNIYAGGKFTTAGEGIANRIAKWNGSAWSTLGSGMDSAVNALAIDGSGSIYAGGEFTAAGGVSASRIAKWNGSNWSALGSGMETSVTSHVNALAIDGSGDLYVGGSFTIAGGSNSNFIAKWNGSNWFSLGSGVGGEVLALTIDGSGDLYAGGYLLNAGDVNANYIAKWNGSTWSPLGAGPGNVVHALAVDGSGNLYAGVYANPGSIAKWNGSAWSSLNGTGLNGGVSALAIDGSGNLYAGGSFDKAGGVNANYIAKWDGSAWSPLGSGMDSYVYALAIDRSGNLYAGGRFSTAGGMSANHIAKWNGSVWLPLGSGMNGDEVLALAIDGSGNLYAGGSFSTAGDSSVNYIAKWNGSTWSQLGTGMGLFVKTLAIDGSGNLYAGGHFTTAGGISANHIAKWNGSAWSALSTGMDGYVSALAIDKSGNLYAGGLFDTAGGATVNNIAKWNGSAWSALDTGMNKRVYSLATDSSGNLYAGGEFTTAGGVSANHIATWDSSAWSALGSAMNGAVNALAIDGSGNLYAGGVFGIAGGKSSPWIAKAIQPATRLMVSVPATATAGTAFSFAVTALNQNGNTVTGYNGTVHFIGSDGTATLPADAQLSDGAGTFTATLNTTGNQTITATETSVSTINGTSNSIAVKAASTTHFSISAPAAATSGSAFTFTVAALDANNNTDTSYSGTIHFTSSDGAATLPANAQLTNGTRTFTATLKTAGNQTVTATDTTTSTMSGSSSTITVTSLTPDLRITKIHNGDFKQGQKGAIYTITITNSGNSPTTGTVTVTDILPSGLTAASISGSGWICPKGTLTCTRSSVLAAGKSYPPITLKVNVDAEASASVTNTVTVSGGGERVTDNNTATDVTTITPVAPDLIITKTHKGNFKQRQINAIYTIKVTNSGNGPTTGTVTVTDTLPSGLTAASISGSGWNCLKGTLTCTRSSILAAGKSYPPITLKVNVDAEASASVTNTVTVSGGGERVTDNDTATDATTVTPVAPDLTITKKHVGKFTKGKAGSYTIKVTNSGNGSTTGEVKVIDTLPIGLTATSITGSGWTCDLATLTCKRSSILKAVASYPPITLKVNVATDAPASVINTVTVSGGGERVTDNGTATDTVTIY